MRAQRGALSPRESAPASDGQGYLSSLVPRRGDWTPPPGPQRVEPTVHSGRPLHTVQPPVASSLPLSPSIPLLALPGVISQINCLHAKLYAKAGFGGTQPRLSLRLMTERPTHGRVRTTGACDERFRRPEIQLFSRGHSFMRRSSQGVCRLLSPSPSFRQLKATLVPPRWGDMTVPMAGGRLGHLVSPAVLPRL